MADSTVNVSDVALATPGAKKLDTTSLTVGSNTVERQRLVVAGAGATELQDVRAVTPGNTDGGAVVRPLPLATATGSAVAAATAIGTTSVAVLAANTANRKECFISNTGITVLYLGLGQTPTALNYHIALAPCSGAANDGTGGVFRSDTWKGAINAIGAVAGGLATVCELTT